MRNRNFNKHKTSTVNFHQQWGTIESDNDNNNSKFFCENHTNFFQIGTVTSKSPLLGHCTTSPCLSSKPPLTMT